MDPDIDVYLRQCNEIARLTIDRSKIERKAVEAWYDSLKPDQQRVFLEMTARGNEHLIRHVFDYAFNAAVAQTRPQQAQRSRP